MSAAAETEEEAAARVEVVPPACCTPPVASAPFLPGSVDNNNNDTHDDDDDDDGCSAWQKGCDNSCDDAVCSAKEQEVSPVEDADADADAGDGVPADGPGPLDRLSLAVHDGLRFCFRRITEATTLRPWTTVLVVTCCTLVLAQGVHVFSTETEGLKLFTPQGSRALRNLDEVKAHYPAQGAPLRLYVARADGGSVLTVAGMRVFQEFHDLLLGTVARRGVRFEDVCEKADGGGCVAIASPASLWRHNASALEGLTDADVVAAVNNESQWRAQVPGAAVTNHLVELGLVRDVDGSVTHVRAATLETFMENDWLDDMKSETFDFQLAVVAQTAASFKAEAARSGFLVEVDAAAEEEEANSSAIAADMKFLIFGYVFMVIYTCCLLGRMRPKYSHVLLALASILSVAMSTASAYGLCWFMGLKFNPIVQVLILVLLGIGIDDTFVIMDSWWDNAHIVDMRERMIAAMIHAGPAITVTSVSDLIAFLAGSATEIPAIKVFCYYAAIGIFFDFAYQITFVVAVLYMDSLRQEKGRWDVFCCFPAGDYTTCFGRTASKAHDESDRGLLHFLVGELLPKGVIGNRVGSTVVFLLTAALLAVASLGWREVTVDYDPDWFIPQGHRYRDVIEMRDAFIGGRALRAQVYTRAPDFTVLATQATLENMTREYESSEWIVRGSTSSWLRAFTRHVVDTSPGDVVSSLGRTYVVPGRFYALFHRYLETEQGKQSGSSLSWADSGNGRVIAMSVLHFVISPHAHSSGWSSVDCMDALRAIGDRYDSFPFTFRFVFWESYAVLQGEITQNLSVVLSCVFVLVALLCANLYIAIYIVIGLACVDVCLIGFMPWLGVSISSISVITIILAVGLSVDYSVHIACAFLTVKAVDNEHHSARAQRAAYALWKMGGAVMSGGFSTFLAIAPMVLASTYGFQIFFRMFLSIIFFGLWFGVLVIPVVLSFIGPQPHYGAADLSAQPQTNPLDPAFKVKPDSGVTAGNPVNTLVSVSVCPLAARTSSGVV